MAKHRRLVDEYQFPGFVPQAGIKGKFGDPGARVVQLKRRSKKQYAGFAGLPERVFTIERFGMSGICRVERAVFFLRLKSGGLIAGNADR